MRLYHFLSTAHAVDDLEKRRLKIAEIDCLNDPFELWCLNLRSKNLRIALRKWKAEMAKKCGLICFSEKWTSPLLWSHYAAKHRGICFGFDVRSDLAKKVTYVKQRIDVSGPFDFHVAEALLFTKFEDWHYEEEWRVGVDLNDRDPSTNLYFCEFGDDLTLREIIVGPLCEITREDLEKLTTGFSPLPVMTKARLAHKWFDVVRDKRGLQ